MIALRYKSYIWKRNPDTLKLERAQNLKQLTLPFAGQVVQDLGTKKRVISGTGRFLGENALKQFQELADVCAEEGGGALYLPGMEPLLVRPLSLEMKGQVEEHAVSYAFSFLEDEKALPQSTVLLQKEYVCKGGESLWDVADQFQIAIEELIRKNTWVKYINQLPKGKKVVLV